MPIALIAVAFVAGATVRAADAHASDLDPTVYVGVGLPAPLVSLGYDTAGEATASRPPRFPFHVEATVGVDGLAAGYLRPELIVSLSGVLGRQDADQSSARWLVVGATPEVVVRPTQRLELHAGPAAGVLSFALIVDEHLRLDTASLGGGLTGGLTTRLGDAERTGVGVRVSSWWFGPPLVRQYWFNEPLGRTRLVTFSVGVSWRR